MIPLFSAIIAFFVSLFSIHWLKPLARRLGLVDLPNNRKHHQGEIPVIGGLAMLIGFLIGLLTLPISLQHYRSFIAGLGLLVFIGLLDDFHELSPKSRFFLQIAAISLMVFWGHVKINHFGNVIFYKDIFLNPYLSFLVTVVAGLGIINAINMTDGVDGLAGTLVLIELLLLTYCAIASHQFLSVNILVLAIAALLAFLWFNFPLSNTPAQLFMGDAGSMFLGFVLVWFLIDLTQNQTNSVTSVTMLWIMSVPLFDTTTVMLYRINKGQSIISSDRQHGHHLLLNLNFSSFQINLILGGINLLLGLIGIAAFNYRLKESFMFISFIISFSIYFFSINYLRRFHQVDK